MLGLAAIQLATPPGLVDADVVLRLVTTAVASMLAGLSGLLSPAVVVALLAVALVAQVVVELARHERHVTAAGPF